MYKVIYFLRCGHGINKVIHRMSSKDKITEKIGYCAAHVDFSYMLEI